MHPSRFSDPVAKQRNSQSPMLENIHVAAPCPADWEKMLGDSRVRHCGECNLNVYNISEMTQLEAEDFIRSHEGRLCVRFFRRADGTILTKNCPRGVKALARRISRIAAAMLTAAVSVGSAFSQNAAKSNPQSQTQDNQAASGLDLTVADPTGAVITNAKAVLCHCQDHALKSANTDAAGVAHFSGIKPGDYSVEIQSPGFKTVRKNVRLQSRRVERLQVKLQVAATSVTVEVAAGGPVAIQGTMGMVTVTEERLPWPTVGGSARPAPLR